MKDRINEVEQKWIQDCLTKIISYSDELDARIRNIEDELDGLNIISHCLTDEIYTLKNCLKMSGDLKVLGVILGDLKKTKKDE